MALENAAYLAQQLDRVLIMPPITTNSHDKHNSNQRWSDFFDLPKFTELTGVRVVEWNDVRPMTAEQIEVGRAQVRMGKKSYEPWEAIAEDLPCQIIYGFGDSERLHTTELTFARQFLFRPRFIRPPPRNPKTIVHDRHKIGAKDNLNMDDIVTIEDLVGRYEDAADHLLFLSHSYKLKDPSGRQSWFKVGQYFHFRAHVLAFASELIQTRAPQTKGPSMRYIAIHLRRGDIWQKCRQETMEERMACLTPLSYYAEVVDKVRASLGQDMPVIVTTDSDSEEDFKTMEELKWARLDHASYSTESRLGIFGPAMVDAVILAEADVMVGTYVSSMSRVAARRQKSWHDRVALYPQTRRV
ncbi:hypothetical protein BGW38_001476 [Lunasporangiospora selenospora]|uniref:GDP-fucose protein O-fucosyltransferase 2 n=1 Tax=Lunasporangiospora selenospora TaxID=979761 RepID=A0A9P6KDH8_9FUNG|nr:hypothetical protein BGW38_001476 [Lunasporangiospora selenospora]